MKCRSCGLENERRNKFCGECGQPLQEERRRTERRIIAWEPQQCRSCGAMNGPTNKFCGMCGQPLQEERRRADRRTVAAAAAPVKPSVANAEPTPTVEPAEGLDDSSRAATSYLGAPPPSSAKPRSEWVRSSGSSFLGLDDEAPASSDYLLADEEPRSGSGWRALVVLLILAIVGYLIFKNWDSPTFAAALSQIHKHIAGASSDQPKPQPPSSEQPSISSEESTPPSDTSKQPPSKPSSEANKPAETQPPSAAEPSTQPDNKQEDSAEPSKRLEQKTPASDHVDSEPENSPAEPSSSEPSNSSVAEEARSHQGPPPGQDLYERGQAYLTGHGAPQSCDQGVVYTRAAAQQGNPKAAVQMGALYATGRCVAQDRVQAYNWFNEALRNDPSNEYVERSRATLWAQMTDEERHRAERP